MLESLDFHSDRAGAIMADAAQNSRQYVERYRKRDPSVRLVIDHAIPIKIMVESLFTGDVKLTRDGVREHLMRWYRLGLLACDEDIRLNEMGLRSAMPSNWNRTDIFARYSAASIRAKIWPSNY